MHGYKLCVICQCLLEHGGQPCQPLPCSQHSHGSPSCPDIRHAENGCTCWQNVRQLLIGWCISWLLVFCLAQARWNTVLRAGASGPDQNNLLAGVRLHTAAVADIESGANKDRACGCGLTKEFSLASIHPEVKPATIGNRYLQHY